MRAFIKYLFVLLCTALLMVGVGDDVLMAQRNSTTTQKKGNTTTQKKTTQSTKKSTSTQKKSTQSPARKTSAQTTANKSKSQKSSVSSKSTTSKSNSSSKKKSSTTQKSSQKKLSRQAYEKQQRDLKQQIADTEKLISNNAQSVRSQSRDISIREDEIRKRQALINSKQQEIVAIIAEEDSLQLEIQNLTASHQATKEKYAAAMCHLYKWRNGYDELLFVLSSEDVLQAMRRMRYLRHYGEWRKAQALLLEQQREATEQAKSELVEVRTAHESKLKEIDRERASLAKKQEIQQAQVAILQKQNKELQTELERDRKKMAEIQQTIQRMIEEEIRQEELRRKAAEEKSRREAESNRTRDNRGNKPGGTAGKSTIKVDDHYTRLSGNFASNKGRLPYPLDSNFAFVERFRPTSGNSSIVLSTRVGAHARAIFEGTVSVCYPSNEEWTVIVQHGNYRSVYMNLQNVSVKAGQKVSVRQQLGTVKPEPDGNRAELRFWIYKGNTAVNPESWLKR